jgi:hypothetical protein
VFKTTRLSRYKAGSKLSRQATSHTVVAVLSGAANSTNIIDHCAGAWCNNYDSDFGLLV